MLILLDTAMSKRVVDRQRGAGLIGLCTALLVYLLLMFAAVQILFNLYATSLVMAAAHDAARQVASIDAAPNRCAATTAAQTEFTRTLGAYGSAGHASLQWTCNHPDKTILRVRAQHPSILPTTLLGLASLTNLDRTIEIRNESLR